MNTGGGGEGGGGEGGGGEGGGEEGRGGRGSSPGDKQLKTQQKSSKFIMHQPPSLFPRSPILQARESKISAFSSLTKLRPHNR